ncbi:MAG TPA: hemerythrin domain-containing protein [Pyrinomonadaceae bacterium]|nr:hemerythrin domain-containing protein [Pyrinomonadaceae bacterium]
MSGPLHTLKHEHRVIERNLRALDGICARLTWGEHVPVDVLIKLVDFISGYTDGFHHLKEETYLFPALMRQSVSRHDGVLRLIEQEHENERQLSAEMRKAIEGYKGVDPDSRRRFVDAARRYSDLLLPHLEHEETILFRLADDMLDENETDFLREAFKHAAAEFGVERLAAYEQMAVEQEEAWGI